jgi:hypothetical protein
MHAVLVVMRDVTILKKQGLEHRMRMLLIMSLNCVLVLGALAGDQFEAAMDELLAPCAVQSVTIDNDMPVMVMVMVVMGDARWLHRPRHLMIAMSPQTKPHA